MQWAAGVTHDTSTQIHINIGRRWANVLTLFEPSGHVRLLCCRQLIWHAIMTLNSSVYEKYDSMIIHAFWSLQHAIDAVSAGVSPIRDTSYNYSYWDKGSAFFFAGTVITTIGKVSNNPNSLLPVKSATVESQNKCQVKMFTCWRIIINFNFNKSVMNIWLFGLALH